MGKKIDELKIEFNKLSLKVDLLNEYVTEHLGFDEDTEKVKCKCNPKNYTEICKMIVAGIESLKEQKPVQTPYLFINKSKSFKPEFDGTITKCGFLNPDMEVEKIIYAL